MISPNVRRVLGLLVVAGVSTNLTQGAEATNPRPSTGKIAPAASSTSRGAPATSKSGSARGPLPDPALLDGSTQPAEKKSDQGMIGDFELPGDDNVKSGKVGGPQNPNASKAGGAQSNTPPTGLPQGGGGGQQSQQAQQNQQGGAQGGAQSAEGGAQQAGGQQQAGGAQAGGAQGQNAAGNPISGAGDPGAQAQGIQVAELGGDAAGQQAGNPGEKPQQLAIGDSAMRIEQAPAQAGVVGAQQPAGQTQQHEKGTGSGGKGAGGAGGGNRIEKGRVIPAGL